ncbi:uncharacterized protein LOC121405042 [Drosophila obscura]|uniref:uncharacterized protein LOC121405042 n=1 Tax=Drosophila obscura TaxID=7282 RepID=UPI001BB16546|nr:uncharacterized protein LOC121405042 [Drosophila obscura]
MSYSPRYVRPTKASNLRALANNLRASNEIAPSVAGARSQSQSPSSRFGVSRSIYTVRDSRSRSRSVFSMPNQGKFSESYSGSFNDHTTEPERSREPRRSPQARSHLNTLAESRALSRATSLATSLAIEGGGKSQLRTVQTQYQKLQTLQSEFVESLKSLDPEDSKLIGTYSFVVLGKDESNRLAQSLPAESVQDLKDRCQAAVDSGFMLLYDHLEPIQMARDEFEACHRKEQLKVKLKDLLSLKMENIVESIDQLCVTPVGPQASPNSHLYRDIGWLRRQKQQMESRFLQLNKDHSEQLNRLKAELEAKLQAGEEHWQQTLDELRERLRRSEVQRKENACQLAVQNAAMTAKDSTIASLQADMNKQISRNMELNQVVKGSDGALLFTQKELEKSREHIAYLEEELNEGRQLIDELQQQQRPAAEDIDQVVEEKDRIIGDLQLKVQDLLQLQAVHEEHEPNTLQLDTQIR